MLINSICCSYKTYFNSFPCAALQGGRLPRPAININRIPVAAIKIEHRPLPHGIRVTCAAVICTASKLMTIAIEGNPTASLYHDEQHPARRITRHCERAAAAQIESVLLVTRISASRIRYKTHSCELRRAT